MFNFFIINGGNFNLSNDNKKIRYNFTKLWFVKQNNFVLLSVFCFFYFKIKKIKKIKKRLIFASKTLKVFFKKKKGGFFKKPLKKLKSNMSLFF
jgi:hypothetical protein